MASDCGKRIRLGRILSPKTGRAVAVAFDHGLDDGPMPGNVDPRATMAKLVEGGADAVLVSPGVARLCADMFAGKSAPALILRMDWTNMFRAKHELGFPEGRNRLIADVEDAIRLGADAVLSFMFVGFADPDVEADDVAKNAILARACERMGVPHIIEPMARGAQVGDRELDPALIRMHVRMAAELGADAIKTDYSGSADTYRAVVEGCPAPILIAGGPKAKSVRESLGMVQGAVEAGAAGVLLGRNVIQAEDPARMLRALRAIVHDGASADDAIAAHLSLTAA